MFSKFLKYSHKRIMLIKILNLLKISMFCLFTNFIYLKSKEFFFFYFNNTIFNVIYTYKIYLIDYTYFHINYIKEAYRKQKKNF